MAALHVCLIGHPVAHSLSPMIHAHWFKQYGVRGAYDLHDIRTENLAEGVGALVEGGYAGFNVTVPHKQALLPLCAALDEEARVIGAVNTVVVQPGGALRGLNTDAFGLIENLRVERPGFDFKESPALVLGAGGAARAVIHALKKAGVGEITIANRTGDKAGRLAEEFGVETVLWEDREKALARSGLLVNTTSLGMRGKEALILDLALLPRKTVVYDIVYRPLVTNLLAAAKARGNPVVTGIGMLLHQARLAFAAWTGIMPDITPELARKIGEAAQ